MRPEAGDYGAVPNVRNALFLSSTRLFVPSFSNLRSYRPKIRRSTKREFGKRFISSRFPRSLSRLRANIFDIFRFYPSPSPCSPSSLSPSSSSSTSPSSFSSFPRGAVPVLAAVVAPIQNRDRSRVKSPSLPRNVTFDSFRTGFNARPRRGRSEILGEGKEFGGKKFI